MSFLPIRAVRAAFPLVLVCAQVTAPTTPTPAPTAEADFPKVLGLGVALFGLCFLGIAAILGCIVGWRTKFRGPIVVVLTLLMVILFCALFFAPKKSRAELANDNSEDKVYDTTRGYRIAVGFLLTLFTILGPVFYHIEYNGMMVQAKPLDLT